jgi:hypothetical protein
MHRLFPCLLLTACVAEPALTNDEAALERAVVPEKELVIRDPSVIGSSLETTFDPAHPSGDAAAGAWSFGRLVHNMLPAVQRDSAAAASALVTEWLATWETDQAPNPGVSASRARPSIRLMVTEPWRIASGCAADDAACVLDMTKAPFRLMAIVNRPDLRVVANDATAIGGEGRFVFQVVGPTLGISAETSQLAVMDPTPKPQKFTVIFEYSLPVAANVDTITWARRWHTLGAIPFGPAFNARLRTITNDFAGADRDPRRPRGNALDQLRTNEVALQGARFPATGFVAAKQFWELREFHLTDAGLTPHTVNLEPSRDFDIARTGQTGTEGTRSIELADYLTGNAAAVLAGTNKLAAGMSGNSALVGSAPYAAWGKRTNPNPPVIPSQGVANDLGVAIDVRDAFAFSTCAGCHRHETDTRHFMHITVLDAMEPLDKADDRTRVGIGADASPDTIVLSNLLAADIAPGGGRFGDFTQLLDTPPSQLADKPGLRMCR